MNLDRKNLRIAVVDDDEFDRELLQNHLIQAGFTHPLVQLRNGSIALEYFKYTKATGALAPHIVLLDINMPLIDGVRALHRLREASSFRDLPVIILSADENPAKMQQVAELGIFRFVKKQPDCADVVAALDDFIRSLNGEGASSPAEDRLAAPLPA